MFRRIELPRLYRIVSSQAFPLAGFIVGFAASLGWLAWTTYRRSEAQKMSSPGQTHGHLDATAGREVVYCHACAGEWYQDENGLPCPTCQGGMTEIIDPDNDLRDLNHCFSTSTSHELPSYDLVPEEADINEPAHNGVIFQRSEQIRPEHHAQHDSAAAPSLGHVLNVLNDFRLLAPGGNRAFPPSPGQQPGEQNLGPRVSGTNFTSVSSFQSTTTVIILGHDRRWSHMRGSSDNQVHSGLESFQQFFSNMLHGARLPPYGSREGEEVAGGFPPGIVRLPHDNVSPLTQTNFSYDEVQTSQEAMDWATTRVMQATPQSKGAPPATEEALRNLERKPVVKHMLSTECKVECTICTDEINEGDMATFLPCGHWYHEECVTLWLKEHNTCPICRRSIEKADESENNKNSGNTNRGDGGLPRELA